MDVEGNLLNLIFCRCAKLATIGGDIQRGLLTRLEDYLSEFERKHDINQTVVNTRLITRFDGIIKTDPVVGNPRPAKTKGSGKNTGRLSKVRCKVHNESRNTCAMNTKL